LLHLRGEDGDQCNSEIDSWGSVSLVNIVGRPQTHFYLPRCLLGVAW